MMRMGSVRVREMTPDELGDAEVRRRPAAGRGWSESTESRLLAPDHPFLRVGAWRAFLAGGRRSNVLVVASLDPRQRMGAGPVGALGFFAASGDLRAPAIGEAFRAAVEAAESWLASGGAVVVRGPVQFATWYGHRAMTGGFPQQGGPPGFPMEPTGPPGLGEALAGAGFAAAHTAASYTVATDAWIAGARLGEERMRAAGFRDRPIDDGRLEDELAALHAISMAAFRGSWGFSDIALDEFASIYRPLMPLADPDFVRIVEAPDGRPVGFIFAFPDPAVGPGRPGARFVAKSIAVLPEIGRTAPGIGTGLSVVVHRAAAARGYRSAIHACVAQDAYTQRISARWGERFRTYATFEKGLR